MYFKVYCYMRVKRNSLKNLKHNHSPYNHKETCVIRVPKIFKEQIKEYASFLDSGESEKSTVTHDLEIILQKVKNKEKGYKSNSASRLIKDLLSLF